jgi:hypothetical protein
MKQHGVQTEVARAKRRHVRKAARYREVFQKMDLHIEVRPIGVRDHGCGDTPNAERRRDRSCEQT